MVIACKGIDILKRVLCLLLCVVLLFCFFMCPRASAVALEATSVAYAGLLVGTLLVGAGVAFSNPGDMAKAGNAMYRTLQKGNEAIASKIAAISAWAVEHGTSLAKGALRVGKDMFQAIVDAYNSLFTSVAYDVTKDNYSKFMTAFNAANVQSVTISCRVSGEDVSYTLSYIEGSDSVGAYIMLLVDGIETRKVAYNQYAVWKNYKFDYMTVSGNSRDSYMKFGTHYRYGDRLDNMYGADSTSEGREVVSYPFSVAYSVAAPDVVYPSDDYLVRMPDIPSVDTATGDVTYPNDTAYTKDAVVVPYPVDTDGVKVPDIPYDKVVDQSTGKTLDDTDTGTDTDNPSKPGEGTDTDNPNWPDTGSLSLPKLIASKFPFCIPFDVARLVGLLEAEPKAPVFRIPVVYANIVNEEIVIDFDKFADVLQIIRWGEIMLFVAGLVVITRNYIKW